MQVVVNSLLTTYMRQGKGKLLLFLHGWGDSSQGMANLQAALAKAGYDVIALDLPGFGGTQMPDSTWGLDNYAQFVAHFLQKINAPQPYAIVGHSNGGALAIRALHTSALQAECVVLLASAGVRTPRSLRLTMLKIAAKIAKIIAKPLPKTLQQKMRRKAYGAIGSEMLLVPHMQETFKRVVGQDVRDDAAAVTIPALLLYGENDTSTPVMYGELYHELLADSTLVILPSAGHFIHMDRPLEVEQHIKDFLQ